MHDNIVYVIVQKIMLYKCAMNNMLQQHLTDVLGSEASDLGACARAALLPYFLQDSFSFLQLNLAGHDVALAIPKANASVSLKGIRAQLEAAVNLLQMPVVFCPVSLASYERRNLIEQKVSFIVPSKQMYLPNLGIDLRENVSQAVHKKTALLSPATQALLLWYLLNEKVAERWHPSDIGNALGYTPMTVSRAVSELVSFGLAESVTVGRSKWLQMQNAKADIWARAKPYLRSPVKRTVWGLTSIQLRPSEIRLAGISALAQLSMLSDPSTQCLAITLNQYNEAIAAGAKVFPQPMPDTNEWQIWSYNPAMVAKSKTVDVLSLWLSLKDNSSERVQMALDELQDKFEW